MAIYVIMVVAILLLAFLLRGKQIKNGKKIYCMIIGLLMLLVMGLRNISLGQYDVEFSYVPLFYKVKELTMSEVLALNLNDAFFHIMTKIFTLISSNVHFWIFCLSIPIVCSVTYLIYKESKIPSLSFILFLGLNYYGYNFTILRHSTALSFIILAYLFYKNEKRFMSIVTFVIACMFHISAGVFIIIFIFGKTKLGFKQIAIVCLALYVSINMSENLLNYIFKYLTSDRFSRYGQHIESFNFTMFLINAFVYIASYINAKKAIKKDSSVLLLFNMSTISLILLSLTTVFALFFRVSMFFGIFNILLLPNTIYYDENKPRKVLLYIGTVSSFSIYFLFFAINNALINPYLFFWQ